MRGSLAVFANALDRTFCSVSLGEALCVELERRAPVDLRDLVSAEATERLRGLIEALVRLPGELATTRRIMDEQRKELIAERPSAIVFKARLLDAVKLHLDVCGTDLVRDLRRATDPDLMLGLVDLGLYMLLDTVPTLHWCEIDAPSFYDSLLTCFLLLEMRKRYDWVGRGGVENISPRKAANDAFDREYVVFASYFDSLLSKDGGALKADRDLWILIDRRRREALLDVLLDHAVSSGRLDKQPAN